MSSADDDDNEMRMKLFFWGAASELTTRSADRLKTGSTTTPWIFKVWRRRGKKRGGEEVSRESITF